MGHRDPPEGVCLVLCSWWLIVQLAPPWPRVSHICTSLTKNSSSQAESILFLRFSDGCRFRYLAEERVRHFEVRTSFFPSAGNDDGFSFMFWPLPCNVFLQLVILSGRSAGGNLFTPCISQTSTTFFDIKVNECKQGEQRVAAAAKDAVLCLTAL